MSAFRSAPCGQRTLFVVGLMRSGTSLLYRLLNNHPQIALLYESDVFALRPLLWPSWRPGTWRERLDFWNGALSRHGIDPEGLASLPSYVHGPADAMATLGQAYARRKPGAYIGGKSIHYYDRLPAIAHAFPTARFVVLWRPIEEIIDSLLRAGESNAYLAPARRQRQIFEQYGELAKGVLALRAKGSQVHELRYEELVSNPKAVCRSLCEFLRLPWSPAMLHNDPANFSPVPDQPHHFHARHTAAGDLLYRRPLETSTQTMAKARFYERYWTIRFAGQPVRLASPPLLPPGSKRPFFALERLANRADHRLFRVLWLAKLVIYRFAPLTLLRWYRSEFGRFEQAQHTMPSLEPSTNTR